MNSKPSENFIEWKANVDRWRIQYSTSTPQPVRSFSLTNIVVIKRCAKCGSVRTKMHRHHKGHEYLFACLMEECYAARYIEFHPSDVAWLCVRCHKRAHTVYKRALKSLWEYVDTRQCQDKDLEYEVLEKYRQEIIKIYERWVEYKKRKRKRKGAKRGNASTRK